MSGHDRLRDGRTDPGGGTGLIVIGGGGHALVVAEAARLAGFDVLGFLDDDENAPLGRTWPASPHHHQPHLPTTPPTPGASDHLTVAPHRLGELRAGKNALREILGQENPAVRAASWTLGIGGVAMRRELIELGIPDTVTVVHPRAWVSPTARLGRGVYVGPGAIIHTRAVLADWAIVNSGAVIEHECLIGENTHIAPGSVLGGATRVGCDTLVGIGSRTIPGICIGSRCTIGAGSVVVRDVPDGLRTMGVPARAATGARRSGPEAGFPSGSR